MLVCLWSYLLCLTLSSCPITLSMTNISLCFMTQYKLPLLRSLAIPFPIQIRICHHFNSQCLPMVKVIIWLTYIYYWTFKYVFLGAYGWLSLLSTHLLVWDQVMILQSWDRAHIRIPTQCGACFRFFLLLLPSSPFAPPH